MGIEIIRLGEQNARPEDLQSQDLAQLSFHDYAAQNPNMFIWFMVGFRDKPFFPWWTYEKNLDSDIQALSQQWSITSPQGLFDCLFLAHLKKFVGQKMHAIFPGNIKTEGWNKLNETERSVFQHGQGCAYHLQGSFDKKLNINWVPFWQPQSLVRNPSFGNLWHLYTASHGDNSTTNLTFFSLSNPMLLPEVTKLLLEPDETRSQKLAEIVDWFGVYSSPRAEVSMPFCVVYTKRREVIAELANLRKSLALGFEDMKQELLKEANPRNVIRALSRQLVL